MAIKDTLLGSMIYATMALWAAAALLFLAAWITTPKGVRRPFGLLAIAGELLFAAGSAVMVAAFVERWREVQHPPLQNMFEVFVSLGMLMWPLWAFCRWFLGARGAAINVLLGLAVLFPAGFVFHAEPQTLPPVLRSWLFVPHVATYMVAYVVLLLAAAQAIMHLGSVRDSLNRGAQYERATYNMIRLGFPLLTLGLVLGAVWGKLAWGDYWQWDPKELWSLTSWLAYIAYLHLRSLYGERFARANSIIAIVGGLLVIATLLWVNLGRIFGGGMHSYAS